MDTGEPGSTGNGIRAMVIGVSVLRAIGRARGLRNLREVAEASELTVSRTQRYLSSLVASGFVNEDEASATYALGEAVAEIGLLALGLLDPIRIGVAALRQHSEQSGLDGHLAVWGTHGPTVIRWYSGYQGYQIKVEEGTTLPVLGSATGRLMAAHRDKEEISDYVDRELAEWNGQHASARMGPTEVESMFADIRKQGFAASISTRGISGLHASDIPTPFTDQFALEAVSVPIIDHLGRVPMALTFYGTESRPLLGDDPDRLQDIMAAGKMATHKLGGVLAPRRDEI